MRLLSVLAIVTFLGGCPVQFDVPDASLPDLSQYIGGAGGAQALADGAAGHGANVPGADGGHGAAASGSGGRGPEDGSDAGVPMRDADGGFNDPMHPGDPNQGPAHVRVLLTDAPAELEQLWVNILGVEGHLVIDGQDHWLPLSFQARNLDLLALRDGKTDLLAEAAIPPGMYRQLRVHVAREATAVVSGGEHHMLPMAAELGDQGVSMDLGVDVKAGVTYTVVLDFDAQASIQTRDQGPVLVPVIRVKGISQSHSGEQPSTPPTQDGGVGDLPPDGGEMMPPPAPDAGEMPEQPEPEN